MKRIIVILIVSTIMSAVPAAAADRENILMEPGRPANEISISYGGLSLPHMANIFGGILGTGLSGGYSKLDKASTVGAICLEYQRHLGRHIAVGGCIVEETVMLTFDKKTGETESGEPIYEEGDRQCNTFLTLMPSVKIPWFYREHVSMYSGFALGAWYNPNGGSSKFGFAGHVSAVGVDAGNSAVRAFAEIGFGFKGLALIGIRFSF